MAAASMLITQAGLAEIINAEQNGTTPVVLTQVAFGTGQYEASVGTTALEAEFKRLTAIAGGAIGDNRLHVSVRDDSADAYTVYEVGIYTDSGTLFAVCSRAVPIIQKASIADAFMAIDLELTNINPDSVTIGDTNFQLNGATTTKRGIVELATDAETVEGRDGSRVVTPAGLKTLTSTDARRGLIEIATDAEVAAGADKERAVTPYGLTKRTATKDRTGMAELATPEEVVAGEDDSRIVTPAGLKSLTSTQTRAGLIEIASTEETLAGSDATRAVTPAGVAALRHGNGERSVRADGKPSYGLT